MLCRSEARIFPPSACAFRQSAPHMISKPTDGLRRTFGSRLPFMTPVEEAQPGEPRRISAAQFKPGGVVRICRGAFFGIEGVVLERHGCSRLILALALSQSGVYLEIDAEMLEAID